MYQIAPNLVRIGFFEPNSFFDVGKAFKKHINAETTLRSDVVLKSTRRANVAADYWMTGKKIFAKNSILNSEISQNIVLDTKMKSDFFHDFLFRKKT